MCQNELQHAPGMLAGNCLITGVLHVTVGCALATGPGKDSRAAGAGVGQPVSWHIQGVECTSVDHATLSFLAANTQQVLPPLSNHTPAPVLMSVDDPVYHAT